MKKIYCLFLFPVFCFSVTFSQNIEFKKKNFDDKEGFEQAMENIKKGDKIFEQKKDWLYPVAIEYYEKANNFNPNNAKLNMKLGVCYLNTNNKAGALKYLKKAYSCDSKIDTKIKFAIAKAYHYSMEWDKAIEYYNQYKQEVANNEEELKIIDKKIKECESGKLLTNNPVNVEIKNLGININTKYNDHSPITTKDEGMLLFTSGRESSEANYIENIYYTYKNNNGWGTLDKLANIIPSIDKNFATVNFSKDDKIMFLYKSLDNNGDLYMSNYKSNKWTAPGLMIDINSLSQESSACLSPDNQTLYIISDREGSMGGSDIFYSIKDENGKWTTPVNIGNKLNTEYNEESVFILNDGKTLLFSSQGHNSMGGYDMFITTKGDDGEWTTPENIGYPFNTPDDEVNIFVLGDVSQLKGYFASVRPEGFGGRDIYSFSFINEDDNIVEKTDSIETEIQDTIQLTDVIYTDDTNDATTYFIDVENNDNEGRTKETVETTKDDNTSDNSDDSAGYTTKNTTTDSWKTKDMSQDNVVFKVQVGASRKPMGYKELHTRYKGDMQVTEIQHEGWYKYLIGEFSRYQDAKELQFTCGVDDAWVVTRKNNIRVNIREVIEFFTTIMPVRFRFITLS